MTYDELVDLVRSYTETSANALPNSIINNFILLTENKILRQIDLEIFRQSSTNNLTAGYKYLTMPADILTHRYMLLWNDDGEQVFLDLRDISFAKEYWNDDSETGFPKYYSVWNESTFVLAPTPDKAYQVELGYIRKPTGLSSTNPTTWLSTNAPEVLLYGCLILAYSYTKGPPEMIGLYTSLYQEAMSALGIEQQGRRRRDEYRDGIIRTELLAANPISPNEGTG